MKGFFAVVLAGLVCAASAWGDMPSAPDKSKLFGILPEVQPADISAYEKSGASAVIVEGKLEGTKTEKDFTAFDQQPFVKSAKTRICDIQLPISVDQLVERAKPVQIRR